MKIICYLPNASENINGIQFKKIDGMMVSVKDIEDLDEEQVKRLSSIDGYAIDATKAEVEAQPEEPETKPEETAKQQVVVQRKRRSRKDA